MNERDINISFVRFISMLMIISCHICQYFDNVFAWWLNCGVQVFLFMSGFLYGQKEIGNAYIFLRKQIPKILIDYYISLIFTVILYAFFAQDILTFENIIKLVFCAGTIEGIGHLWFISTIIFCYLLTPIFSTIVEKIVKKSNKYVYLFLLLFFIHMEIKLIIPFFKPAWINCYVIGLIIGKLRIGVWREKWWSCIGKIFIPLCIIFNGIQIYQDYFIQYSFQNPSINQLYNTFCNYAHVFLGITVFILLYKMFEGISKRLHISQKIKKVLKLSDAYSYDIFLAHNMWLNFSPVCIWNTNLIFILKCIVILGLILVETLVIVGGNTIFNKLLCFIQKHKKVSVLK